MSPSPPQTAQRVLVTFAVGQEAVTFRRLAADLPHVKVVVTGMGRRNATREIEPVLDAWKPALVLSCGFAGALDPALVEGDLLVSGSAETAERCAHLISRGARSARFHCADRVVITAAEKQTLREATAADAVEMESGAINEICHARGIPCAIIRVVLDTALEDLPLDFNAYLDADCRLRIGRIALAVMARPGKIRALIQFKRRSALGAQRLAEVLMLCVGPPMTPTRGPA